ncbi:MAG: hypothetical protein IJZ42_01555 [Lachnospiraceae bacterium]|nr:hypothetical protein [Lachnospiraceae bacterium]
MKKTISIILAILIISTLLCSCGGATVKCDFCDAEYVEAEGETRDLDGETIYICPDCYEYMTEGLE